MEIYCEIQSTKDGFKYKIKSKCEQDILPRENTKYTLKHIGLKMPFLYTYSSCVDVYHRKDKNSNIPKDEFKSLIDEGSIAFQIKTRDAIYNYKYRLMIHIFSDGGDDLELIIYNCGEKFHLPKDTHFADIVASNARCDLTIPYEFGIENKRYKLWSDEYNKSFPEDENIG